MSLSSSWDILTYAGCPTNQPLHLSLPFQSSLSLVSSHAILLCVTSFLTCCSYNFKVRHPHCVDQLYNQKICITYIVRTQLYIFTQNSTYNYMFRPCISAIVRLYYKLNKQLYNMCVGYSGGNEILSYSSG
jgi:hypothetical protein